MKKIFPKLFFLLTFFAILFLVTPQVLALTVDKVECSDGFSFELGYDQFRAFRENDWIVSIIDQNGKSTDVTGVWTNENTLQYGFHDGYLFQSNSFVPEGKHTVNVTRRYYSKNKMLADGTFPLLEEESKTFLTTCPSVAFSCSKTNIAVKDCYTISPYFYAIFSGVNNQIALQDFYFKLDGTTYKWSDTIPADTTYSVTSDGEYVFRFPVNGSNIEWATFGLKKCDPKRYPESAVRVQCNTAKPCTQDSQCSDYENCDSKKNVCRAVQCQKCERLKNHACSSTCVSPAACGTSSCVKDTCVINKTGCKNSNIKITANVIETTNSNTESNGFFSRLYNWFIEFFS